jgi:hypothetical protein
MLMISMLKIRNFKTIKLNYENILKNNQKLIYEKS